MRYSAIFEKKEGETCLKPRKRSWLRMTLGGLYFSFRRYLQWYFSGINYVRQKWEGDWNTSPYSHVVFVHQSLLLRRLRNVDMWLQHNKVQNLRIAIQKLDRLVLKPGETMSFWRLVGSTGKRKGYLKGMELYEGTFRPAYGGGYVRHNQIWRRVYTSDSDSGKEELITENHALMMYSPLLPEYTN